MHLQPVEWRDNWPVMGIDKDGDYCGDPVKTYRKPKTSKAWPIQNPVESDEFNQPLLGKQWQWHANYNQFFGMPTSFGTFRVYNHKLSENFVNLWEVPNLLLQKTPADKFTATAKVRVTAKDQNQFGGLIMMGLDYSAIVVKELGMNLNFSRLLA